MFHCAQDFCRWCGLGKRFPAPTVCAAESSANASASNHSRGISVFGDHRMRTDRNKADGQHVLKASRHKLLCQHVPTNPSANFAIFHGQVCADRNKPDGQYVLPATLEAVSRFVAELPIRKVPGIGKVRRNQL